MSILLDIVVFMDDDSHDLKYTKIKDGNTKPILEHQYIQWIYTMSYLCYVKCFHYCGETFLITGNRPGDITLYYTNILNYAILYYTMLHTICYTTLYYTTLEYNLLHYGTICYTILH